jgi:hypothetical protein
VAGRYFFSQAKTDVYTRECENRIHDIKRFGLTSVLNKLSAKSLTSVG